MDGAFFGGRLRIANGCFAYAVVPSFGIARKGEEEEEEEGGKWVMRTCVFKALWRASRLEWAVGGG